MALDPSWHAVLEYAALHHWQFGTQIVFTYGPLGYLAAPTSLGHMVSTRVAFAFFWSLVVSVTSLNLARRLPMPVRVAFIGWLIAFPLAEGLDQTAFWVLAAATLLILSDSQRDRWQYPICLAAFILLALIKFSFFTAGAASVAVVGIYWASQRKFREATILAVAAPAAFVLAWKACDQPISNLGLWIHHGLQLESGYSAAMNLTPKSSVLLSAAAGLTLLAGGALALLIREKQKALACATALTLVQYSFLAWKEGFTRSGDWHAYVFLWYLPLGMAFYLLRDGPSTATHKPAWVLRGAFAASIVIALAGSHFQIPGFAWSQATNWPRRLACRTAQIGQLLRGQPGGLFAEARKPSTVAVSKFEHACDVIGDGSVDVMNYLQQVAIVNNLNYRPRPVFQGFVAYTPELQTLNENFFEGAYRPQFVVLDQHATDHRFPTIEDSAAQNFVLNNYVPVARDGNFLVLHQSTTERLALRPAYETIVRFGESIDLRPWSSAPLFISAEIEPSLPGHAATILYQPTPLSILVASGESEHRYRLVASMAQKPFLISPILDSNYDVLNLLTAQSGKTVDRVTFEPPHVPWEFHDSFRVRLFTALDFPHAAKAVSPSRIFADVEDRVFWPMPTSVSSTGPARLAMIHGTAAVMVTAPSTIVLDIPSGATSFSGYFGFAPGNSGEMAKSVRIFIEVKDAQGRSVVKMDRTLDSASLSLDRNRFSFHVPVDSARDRTISLKTDSVPIRNDGSAASFWSNCRFDPSVEPH